MGATCNRHAVAGVETAATKLEKQIVLVIRHRNCKQELNVGPDCNKNQHELL